MLIALFVITTGCVGIICSALHLIVKMNSKLWKWSDGRQLSGYQKFTSMFSKTLKCDAYILRIPKDAGVPPHSDPVPNARHYRINVTVFGHLRMETTEEVFRIGDWFSFSVLMQ